MLEQTQQGANKIKELLANACSAVTHSAQLDNFQQMLNLLESYQKEEFAHAAILLLSDVPIHLLTALLDYLFDRIALKNGHLSLQSGLLAFFTRQFDSASQPDMKHAAIMENLMLSKSTLLEQLCLSCGESQQRALNILCSANQMLVSKANKEPIINFNFTCTTILSLKALQSPSAEPQLQEQALRHLLLLELIQKGQISELFLQSEELRKCLLRVGQQQNLGPYWLALVGAFAQTAENHPECSRIYQLEQFGMKLVSRAVEQGKDLTEEVYNLLQSDKSQAQKKSILQTIRAICLFLSGYILRLAKTGFIEESLVHMLEQLMSVQDFLAFEFIARAYAHILQLDQRKHAVLSPQLVFRIQRNCLPQFRRQLFGQVEFDPAKIHFLSHEFQNLVQYSVSAESSNAMKILSDRILAGRGCLLKAAICSCYDHYIHSTIQAQYDQEFNEHEFMSVTHLVRREITRVCALAPDQQQLFTLKEYLMNNIKWLLNLNESCLPTHRKCINQQTLDLVLAFPFILKNNEFLERVSYDLLIERIPHTFHHLQIIIEHFRQQENQGKLERASEQLIERAKAEGLSLLNKICIWDLVFMVNEKNDRLGELLQVYSLHEDQWIAKYCAAKARKVKLPENIEQKALQVVRHYQKNKHFFKAELKLIETYAK